MWFGVLGPMDIRTGQADVVLAGARQRTLLAGLLVRAGHAVSQDELGELVWDGTPPSGAPVTLRSYVARLRRALGPEAAARIVTRSPGYLIDAQENEVDLLQFTGLCQAGAASLRDGSWARASDLITRALTLWRGAPLADVPSAVLCQNSVPQLEELRLQALEHRMAADLHLGRHGEVIVELQQLAADHPLRERLQAQLMLALYRTSRQADALQVYLGTRDQLVSELGVEPGRQLRRLYQRILAQDPALDCAA